MGYTIKQPCGKAHSFCSLCRPDVGASISVAAKKIWQDPTYREKVSATLSAAAKRWWATATPEQRKAQIASMNEGQKRWLATGKLGEAHPNWRGGKTVDGKGYVRLQANGHQTKEHRVVMEQLLGRPLTPIERVHHINGDRADNRPLNLQLCESESEHQRLYHSGH